MAFNPNDPYRPLFGSMADQKSAALAVKYEQKKQAIDPTPPPVTVDVNPLLSGGGESNLLDVGQAGLAKAGGSLMDAAKYVSNEVLDTEFDDSTATGWSNQDVADALAGVSPEVRAAGQAQQQQVVTDVANEDYGSALINAIKAGPFTAMDSAGTLAEVVGGTALTALTGGVAAPLVFGKKIKGAVETAEKVGKAYDKAKSLKEATRMGKVLSSAKHLPAATAKAAGRASLLTADMTQQSRSEYIAKHGEEPSGERVAVMALTNMATSLWEPVLMAQLFIPNFKKEAISELRNLAKNLGKGSNLASIGKRIGQGIKKVSAAGAGEGLQEYVQTWQQGLVAELTPEQTDNLWASVRAALSDADKQDEAIVGGLLGVGAGGAIRAGISAPAIAAVTAVDLAKATTKGVVKTAAAVAEVGGKVAQKQVVKAADKVYSPEERADAVAEYNIRKAAVEDKQAEMEVTAKKAESATSYEDILKDRDLRAQAIKAQEELQFTKEDLKNPKNLKRLQDAIVRNNRAEQKALDLKLKGSTLAKVAAQVGTNVKEGVVKVAEDVLDSDQVKSAIEQTKKVKDVSVNVIKESVTAIKEIRSSAALGLVELAIDGSEQSINDGMKVAEKLEFSDLKKAASAVAPHSPAFAKQLRRLAARKRKILMKSGLKTDDVISKETISPAITDTVNRGKVRSKQAVGVAAEIRNALAGKVQDPDTLAQINAALDIYEDSAAFKQQKRGSMSPTDIKSLRKKISNEENRLGRMPTLENIGKVVMSAAETVGPKVKKLRKGTWKKYVKAQRLIKDVQKNETVQQTVKRVQDAMENLDETAEDYADKLDRKLEEKFGDKPAESTAKVLPTGGLKAKLETVEDAVDDGTIDRVMGSVEKIANAVKKAGYTTAADLDALVKQFPKLGQHPEFYGKLASYFEAKPPTEPETNVVMNPEDRINEEEDVVLEDSYMVDLFKTLTGCKS